MCNELPTCPIKMCTCPIKMCNELPTCNTRHNRAFVVQCSRSYKAAVLLNIAQCWKKHKCCFFKMWTRWRSHFCDFAAAIWNKCERVHVHISSMWTSPNPFKNHPVNVKWITSPTCQKILNKLPAYQREIASLAINVKRIDSLPINGSAHGTGVRYSRIWPI